MQIMHLLLGLRPLFVFFVNVGISTAGSPRHKFLYSSLP